MLENTVVVCDLNGCVFIFLYFPFISGVTCYFHSPAQRYQLGFNSLMNKPAGSEGEDNLNLTSAHLTPSHRLGVDVGLFGARQMQGPNRSQV